MTAPVRPRRQATADDDPLAALRRMARLGAPPPTDSVGAQGAPPAEDDPLAALRRMAGVAGPSDESGAALSDAAQEEIDLAPPGVPAEPTNGAAITPPTEGPGFVDRLVDAAKALGSAVVHHPIETLVETPVRDAFNTLLTPVEGETVSAARALGGKGGIRPAGVREGDVISRANTPGAISPETQRRAGVATLGNVAGGLLAGPLGTVGAGAVIGAANDPEDPLVGAVLGAAIPGAGKVAGKVLGAVHAPRAPAALPPEVATALQSQLDAADAGQLAGLADPEGTRVVGVTRRPGPPPPPAPVEPPPEAVAASAGVDPAALDALAEELGVGKVNAVRRRPKGYSPNNPFAEPEALATLTEEPPALPPPVEPPETAAAVSVGPEDFRTGPQPVVSANGQFDARPGVLARVNRELAGKPPAQPKAPRAPRETAPPRVEIADDLLERVSTGAALTPAELQLVLQDPELRAIRARAVKGMKAPPALAEAPSPAPPGVPVSPTPPDARTAAAPIQPTKPGHIIVYHQLRRPESLDAILREGIIRAKGRDGQGSWRTWASTEPGGYHPERKSPVLTIQIPADAPHLKRASAAPFPGEHLAWKADVAPDDILAVDGVPVGVHAVPPPPTVSPPTPRPPTPAPEPPAAPARAPRRTPQPNAVNPKFRLDDDAALADRLREVEARMEDYGQRPETAGWTRFDDDESIMRGGATAAGRRLADDARIASEIRDELRARGHDVDAPILTDEDFTPADEPEPFDPATDVPPEPAGVREGGAGVRERPAMASDTEAPRQQSDAEYLNTSKFGPADTPLGRSTRARIDERVARLRAEGMVDKGYQSFAEQNRLKDEFKRKLVADPNQIDQQKLKRLDGFEVVALHDVVSENVAIIESASRAVESGTLAGDDLANALHTIDEAQRATDEALATIVTEKAQTGRSLGFFRQLAHRSLSPEVWLVQAKKLAGDRPLPDAVMLEIRRLANEAADVCGGA